MLASLTQSDIIAIVVGLLQIVVAFAVGIWTVSRAMHTQQSSAESTAQPKRGRIRVLSKYSWVLAIVLATYAANKLVWLYVEDAQVTSTYLYQVMVWASFLVFNLVLAWTSWVFASVVEVFSRFADVQQRTLDLQEKTVSVAQGALTNRPTPTRRKRRAG